MKGDGCHDGILSLLLVSGNGFVAMDPAIGDSALDIYSLYEYSIREYSLIEILDEAPLRICHFRRLDEPSHARV